MKVPTKPPKPLSTPEFIARHAAVLVEMARWPNGAPPTEATPGWVMARFCGAGLAERRRVETRIGVEVLFFLTDAGRRTAEVVGKSVARGRG